MKEIDGGGLIMQILRSQGKQWHRRCWAPGRIAEHIATGRGSGSTGVGGRGDEPIGDSLGELVKGVAFPASVTADLAVVEDQG